MSSFPMPMVNPTGEAGYDPKSSIYVGDLRKDVNESTLYHHFKDIGQIMSVRVLYHAQTRASLGYAYVNFFNAADAKKAIDELQYSKIGGKPCRLAYIERDPTTRRNFESNVYVRNLEKTVTPKEFDDFFSKVGDVRSSKLATNDDGVPHGYGFVQYTRVEDARKAIEDLDGKKMSEAHKPISVQQYIPKEERVTADPEKTFTNLYISGIPKDWTDEQFLKLCSSFGEVTSCILKRDAANASIGIGFSNFKDHDMAVKAIEAIAARGDEMKAQRFIYSKDRNNTSANRNANYAPGTNVYVRHIPYEWKDEQLRDHFSSCGNLVSAHVMTDRRTRASRGFGFVVFDTAAEAENAIKTKNGEIISNKPLIVTLYQTREQRASMMQTMFRSIGTNAPFMGQMPMIPGMMPGMMPPMMTPGLPRNRGVRLGNARAGKAQNRNARAARPKPEVVAAPVATAPVVAAPIAAPVDPAMEDELRNDIGELIYGRVLDRFPDDEARAGKVTGMILEGRPLAALAELKDQSQDGSAFDHLIDEANALYISQ